MNHFRTTQYFIILVHPTSIREGCQSTSSKQSCGFEIAQKENSIENNREVCLMSHIDLDH